MNKIRKWTEEELEIARKWEGNLQALAEKLGRSSKAIYQHRHRIKNPEYYRSRDHREAYRRNRKNQLAYKKEYRQRPEVKTREAARIWKKRQNPAERVRHNLSRRLAAIMRGEKAGRSVFKWLGCDGDDLRRHLEGQFRKGMTWANYGTHWHVDHLLPCASFDHNDPEQIRQCWHWTNLRPMWAKDNIAKGAKITEPQMALRLSA